MRVAVVASEGIEDVESAVEEHGLVLSEEPEVVVSYGGDGTLLRAENRFPGVPKLFISNSETCHKCEHKGSNMGQLLKRLGAGDFDVEEHSKLQCGEHTALNEFQLHNHNPTVAIRFSAKAGKQEYDKVIGDGAIVSTPFGSTGYYRSAGGKPFETGIGFILNNPHNVDKGPIVIPEGSRVAIVLMRGPAVLCWDNAGCRGVEEGERVEISSSKQKAKFVVFP